VKEGDLVAGRYRLLRRIGAGAMGTVWAARHELLGRDLALKICGAGEGEARARQAKRDRDLFLCEVRTVGRLRHPNVVEIVDAGEAGHDRLYLAMELLEGESLAERLAAGPLPPGDALAVAAEVCRGLAAAHAAGVVHRDLKPENVFLARGPGGGVVPKLLDFGVASTGTNLPPGVFGTPAYMSPEQALGEERIDARTDLWALGVVLYEMLTGRLPFEAETYPALLPKIIEQPYPPLSPAVPAEVQAIVAGCLTKDRDARYAGAEAVLQAIERAYTSLPTPEPASARSGFFVETGRAAAPALFHDGGDPQTPATGVRDGGDPQTPATGVQVQPAPPAHGARLGLALAVVALPLAIGAAAILLRPAGPPPAAGAQAEPPPPAVTMGEIPKPPAQPASPAPTLSASAARSAARTGNVPPPLPRQGGKSRVTGVTTAGF
jgi:serine/threonine-protein kinase